MSTGHVTVDAIEERCVLVGVISADITEDIALDYIVDKAIEFKLGGRGLRSICELVMTDAMYELPSKKNQTSFIITEEYAREKIEKSKYAYLKVA